MEANTIEPNTGASTCAFGSQMWTPNIGSFTAKAIIKQKILKIVKEDKFSDLKFSAQFILSQNLAFIIHNRIPKKGIEAVKV